MTNRAQHILVTAAILIILGWFATTLSWPLGGDNGTYAWVGDIIVSGGTPYKDAWDCKGPLVFYLYALVQMIFGRNQWGIRLFDFIILISGAVSLWHIQKKLGYSKTAPLASLLYFLWYASTGLTNTAGPDGWASVMVIFLVDLLVSDDGLLKIKTALWAGLLLGLLALHKPPYVLFFMIILSYLFELKEKNILGDLIFITQILLVFMGMLALGAGWLLWKQALKDAVNILIDFNLSLNWNFQYRGPLQMVSSFIHYFLDIGKIVAVVFSVLGIMSWPKKHKMKRTILTWILIAIFLIVVQNKFSLVHWHLFLPVFAMLTSMGLNSAWAGWDKQPTNRKSSSSFIFSSFPIISVLTLILFATAVIHPIKQTAEYGIGLIRLKPWSSYYEKLTRSENSPDYYSSVEKISAFVRDHSDANDTILVWGLEKILYYLTERKSPTRLGGIYPLIAPSSNPNITINYRQEYLDSIKKSPPRFFIIMNDEYIDGEPKILCYFDSFVEIKTFILTRYRLIKTIGGNYIYLLISANKSVEKNK